jgi:hypothetical protein
MHSVQIFCENPAPKVKSAATGVEITYTHHLPYVSERGAARIGPNARATTNRVSGKIATVVLTLKSSFMALTAGVIIEVPRALK